VPNHNPGFPDVLGNEGLYTRDQKSRVWSGAPARWLRLPSTTAETISALKMSAAVNPLSRASIPTVVDICLEGNEYVALPKLAKLLPNSDNVNTGWTDQAGGTASLFNNINEDSAQWPGPADDGVWVQATSTGKEYAHGVDATLFNGGAATNGRIFFVGVGAILAANTGFRQIACKLLIDGVLYDPAGGSIREVHGYGKLYEFYWGEINPATQRPWVPSDIAKFDLETDCGVRYYSYGPATSSHYPKIMASSLNVRYLETENRVAVGVYRRPEDIGNDWLVNVTTDALRALPGGAANWSKPVSGNFLYGWRQSASPAVYGPVVGTDVRWNGLYQDLGPDGEPPGIVYPLQSTGDVPPPAGAMCSQAIAYDIYGRPQERFAGTSRATYALALVRQADGLNSVDSQPYRLDLADLVQFKQGTGITAQRFTPASSQAYAGFRVPIIPPFADCTLTVSVHRVSDGVQMGGNFQITAANVGKIKHGEAGLRYLTGFFSSPASLVGGTQYEVRLASTLTGAGVDNWIIMGPDSSLAPTTGFGGTTSGAVIAGVHQTSRDLSINLIKQPDPPTGCTATLANVPITTPYLAAQIPTRQSVNVAWTVPASGMGSLFRRYELEHSEDLGVTWHRIANINNSAITSRAHREAARNTTNRYRIRAVGKDGRVSTWATSGDVTPTTTGLVVILTSDHEPTLEVAYFYEKDSSFLVLSTEGDETVHIHGSGPPVVFMEPEDRGVGWQVNIWVNQASLVGKGGEHVLTPLLNLIRPDPETGELRVPYVCVMDNQGSRFLGHVSVSEVPQLQPAHRYTAQITVTPTSAEPVPVEVS
jgi:hypothetical protein